MYKLMRNIHLALGLQFLAMALVFAVSSLVIIYRPFLPQKRQDSQRVIAVEAQRAASPRALALELMRSHGLSGDLREIRESASSIRLRILRPGTESTVVFDRGSGQATIDTRRYGILETLVQLHVNHGFWHEFFAANAWSLLSLLASIGLLMLGATGLYLWFRQHRERFTGSILVTASLIYALSVLALARA